MNIFRHDFHIQRHGYSFVAGNSHPGLWMTNVRSASFLVKSFSMTGARRARDIRA